MKIILSILLCAAALPAGLGAAQPAPMPRAAAAMAPSRQVPPPAASPTHDLSLSNSIPPAPGADRFLFVVDHSSSMRKLGPAARETVAALITHGFDGRMMPGDSFGVWTVSAKPQTGVFPMQVWDKEHSFDQASLSANYLKGVPWEGRANFAGLLAALRPIVSEVRDLNILLITDGETMFNGSPADDDLNQQLKARSKDARRLGKPMIITFATRDGRMIGYKVTLAGDSIALPPRPAVVAAKPVLPPVPATPVEKMASRSIIITKATHPPLFPPEALPPSKPAPAVAPTPSAPTATANLPVTTSPLPPATNHFAEVATNSIPATEIAAHLAPAPVVPVQIPAQVAPSRPQAPAPTPADPTNATPAPEETDSNPPTLERIPALEPPERPVTFRAATPSTPAPATTEAATAPSTTSGHGETSRFAALLEKKMLVFAREPGSIQPPASQPGQAAARMEFWDTRLLMILGGALLIVALILLWLALRHQRHTGDTSLISRSMDRR